MFEKRKQASSLLYKDVSGPSFHVDPAQLIQLSPCPFLEGPMGLVKSLQQSASETALCVDIRLAAAILTNLLSKQAVCLFTSSTSSGGKYVQIPRASVKLLVTYFMYTPLCKVYVSKYYQAGYIHKHPTDLTGHPHRTDTCSVWVMRFLQGRVAVVIFRL